MKKLYLPSLRGFIGDWVYYPCLMKLKDIAERVSLAKEIYESKNLTELVQRELRINRGKEIKEYLIKQEQRFFNSLIVAVYEGEPNWYEITHLEGNDLLDANEVPNEVVASMGILSLSGGEKLFALDGQHRLVGIQQAIKEKPSLSEDELTIIFIAHKTDAEGKKRSRRLFTTLNKNAKPVSKGEIIAFDEDDTMAIIARRLVMEHPMFRDRRISNNLSSHLLVNDFTSLTTIANLYDLLGILFTKIYGKRTKKQLTARRLSDEALDGYYQNACDYFERLSGNFPPLKEFLEASDYPTIVKKYRHSEGGNILFRPVGLTIITEIVAMLSKKYKLDECMKRVSKLPLELTAVPYNNVIWHPIRKTILNKRKSLVTKLLLYMLGEYEAPDGIKKDEFKIAL